jgi:hypothetical protein
MFGNLAALVFEAGLLAIAVILKAVGLPDAVLAIGRLLCLSKYSLSEEHNQEKQYLKHEFIISEPWLVNGRGFCVCGPTEISV